MFLYYSTGYDENKNFDFLNSNREMYSIPGFIEEN